MSSDTLVAALSVRTITGVCLLDGNGHFSEGTDGCEPLGTRVPGDARRAQRRCACGSCRSPDSVGDMPSAALPTLDEVRRLLRGVIDPELGSDIVELGMVDRVDVAAEGL